MVDEERRRRAPAQSRVMWNFPGLIIMHGGVSYTPIVVIVRAIPLYAIRIPCSHPYTIPAAALTSLHHSDTLHDTQ